jgi:hypothetical protein
MGTYKLRYFFDPGSGICLWSENDLDRDRFGYPVELDSLELTSSVKRQAETLIAWFDTSLDWNDPSASSPWSDVERERFQNEAARLLRSLQETLGAAYEIRDCIRWL